MASGDPGGTLEGIVLGIDTASDEPSLALVRGDEVLAGRTWQARETMSRELLSTLDDFLREAEVPREALGGVAVNVGPGQYGALRSGVATAQGLAVALDIPLAGVGRLEADAVSRLTPGATVIAVHDAGRSGYAWAAYALEERGAPPQEVVAPRLDDAGELAGRAPTEATWCGEIDDELRAALDERFGAIEIAAITVPPRAVSVVRLGLLHAAFGDPAVVDVVYLRPPPITPPRGDG